MAQKTDTHDAHKADRKGGNDTHYEIKAKNATEEDKRFLAEHADELSKTTQRAKWIHSTGEHEDHKGQSLATREHAVIQAWAEDKERQGAPATVPGTEHGDTAGVLRFDFPGYGGQKLEHISWDEWFKPFDERELVFIYQEHKKDGSPSTFFILDNPEREDG
ncbi:MAG: hypothetical protein M3Y74_14585 [Chloroflexota bacterium]|nr:hypothetical protein [Chloroflexota bacterium]